jgi:hypothetical protein
MHSSSSNHQYQPTPANITIHHISSAPINQQQPPAATIASNQQE